ncbi:MAG: MlaD family protein [Paludibacter sp.]|nr:MlaD family protein [Paludibacter sp.]
MKKTFFTREVKVGIMAIVAIFILYFGINFLKGIDIFKSVNYFYGKYENIDGLVPSSPVMIKGYKAGQVEEVKYDFTKEIPFTVKISIDKDIVLPRNTKIELFDDGLLGGKAIQLVLIPSVSQNYYTSGDTIESQVRAGLIEQLAGELLPKIDSLIVSANNKLNSLDTESLNSSLASFKNIAGNLENTSLKLDRMMQYDIPQLITNVNSVANNFDEVSGNLKKVDFEQTFASIDSTLANLKLLTEKINSDNGSLGLLLNDKTLYDNLNTTVNSVDKLMIDLKQNPKRYVHFSLW